MNKVSGKTTFAIVILLSIFSVLLAQLGSEKRHNQPQPVSSPAKANDRDKKSKKEAREWAQISLPELSNQFAYNSVVAEDKWMGKRIKTRATVESVDDGIYDGTVRVTMSHGGNIQLNCNHSRGDHEFRKIGKGKNVWIIGTLTSEVMGLGMTECSYHYLEPKSDSQIALDELHKAITMRNLRAAQEQKKRDEIRRLREEEQRLREEEQRLKEEAKLRKEKEELKAKEIKEWALLSERTINHYSALSNSERQRIIQDSVSRGIYDPDNHWEQLSPIFTSICLDTGVFQIPNRCFEPLYNLLYKVTVRSSKQFISSVEILNSPGKTAQCLVMHAANRSDALGCIRSKE